MKLLTILRNHCVTELTQKCLTNVKNNLPHVKKSLRQVTNLSTKRTYHPNDLHLNKKTFNDQNSNIYGKTYISLNKVVSLYGKNANAQRIDSEYKKQNVNNESMQSEFKIKNPAGIDKLPTEPSESKPVRLSTASHELPCDQIAVSQKENYDKGVNQFKTMLSKTNLRERGSRINNQAKTDALAEKEIQTSVKKPVRSSTASSELYRCKDLASPKQPEINQSQQGEAKVSATNKPFEEKFIARLLKINPALNENKINMQAYVNVVNELKAQPMSSMRLSDI